MLNSAPPDLRRYIAGLLFVLSVFSPCVAAEDGSVTPMYSESQNPTAAKEHIVFQTNYGPLLFALYPEVAPKHVEQILKMVKAGLYDTTHFFRIIPGFLVQVSQVDNRLIPLSESQKALVGNIPGEFSNLKHIKGRLTMARWDNDINSASSSFCIMVGSAPHLDGSHTIFGELSSGGSVVNKMLASRRNGETPLERITISRAYVITDLVPFFSKHPFDPPANIGAGVVNTEHTNATAQSEQTQITNLVAILVLGIMLVGLLGFFLFDRISKNRLLSLLLVNVLISGFILLILFVPTGHEKPWVAVLLFLGMFGLFQLMSRFEKNR